MLVIDDIRIDTIINLSSLQQVRIFGVPVYERGQRVRDSPGTTGIQQPPPPQPSSPEANEIYRPESTKDESSTKESEEMPSIPK